MQYDGSVSIDTRMDTKGFNKGTKSITSSLGGVLKSVMAVAKVMAAAFVGGSIISGIRSVIGSFDLMNSSIGGSLKTLSTSFASLKSSFASLVLTAFAPMIPYVIAAVNWLTKLFTTLAQVTAALFGTQVAMAGVADETAGAGKEAKKAAGALAGFDQINVLSKQEDNAAAGASVLPSGIVPEGLLDKVQAFKDKMLTFLQPVTDALGRLKDALLPLGETIWAGLKWAWDNILVPLGEWVITDLLPAFLDLLAGAADVLNEALKALAPLWQVFFDEFLQPLAEWAGGKIIEFLDWLTIKLGELAVWINENPEKFQTFATVLGIVALAIGLVVLAAWLFLNPAALIVIAILAIIAVIMNWESITKWYVETAKKVWTGFFDFLKGILEWYFGTASKIWSGIGEGIKNAFNTALDWVQDKFITIFEGIKGFVKSIINDMIGLINGMIGGIVGGINGLVDGFNAVGSIIPGFSPASYVTAPQIPYLATGAVIPPNSQFMAVLGDQRSGRNIEAPEGLIRQIVREELQGAGGGDITVNMPVYLDSEKIYDGQKKVQTRRGGSLITSGALS